MHYDAARSAEVFIHRAGRTARARAAGLSLSIVAPRDDANHRQTCSVLGLHGGMQAFPLDVRMVERARERVGMALRVRGGGVCDPVLAAVRSFFARRIKKTKKEGVNYIQRFGANSSRGSCLGVPSLAIAHRTL